MNMRLMRGALAGALLALLPLTGLAHGVLPETSVVILEEEKGGGSIAVKNTEDKPVLLHSKVYNLAEDEEELVLLTPVVARVEAGKSQQVRFVLQNKTPLTEQRLKRVTFEGIPQAKQGGGAVLQYSVMQDLPLIIHPKGLAKNHEPWKLLKWRLAGGELRVENDSPYVVRLAQQVRLMPAGEFADLGKTYLLPGQKLAVPAPVSQVAAVTIYPATVYGYAVDSYDAPLTVEE
ncbi:fimbria/pilus chaperone family protein [Chromobacterium amazonense]|uniref:Fimbria/pilus chaperone family protein n=1 Tax=Chromobacterium amazonense TaxID=1382803 RepID=A0ABU8UY75_9NEIS|nr:fimbria/pilus chaperone family protein [Chromobacterium amazonense]MDQ4540972.1 fimbria/pilus chaperone family protein [Chromobacterium amazonense]